MSHNKHPDFTPVVCPTVNILTLSPVVCPTINILTSRLLCAPDELPEHSMQDIAQADRKHETAAKKKVSDMYPETRKLLQNFYGRYNEELAVLLNDTGFLWLPTS